MHGLTSKDRGVTGIDSFGLWLQFCSHTSCTILRGVLNLLVYMLGGVYQRVLFPFAATNQNLSYFIGRKVTQNFFRCM